MNDYKGVLVYAEQRQGELQDVAIELLGEGRKLADKRKANLAAVVIGDKVKKIAEELFFYGADEVYYVEDKELKNYNTDAYSKAFEETINNVKPEIVLIGATTFGRDLAPRVSARIETGLTADCTSLDIDEENGNLLQTRPAFGGNVMATIICPDHRPQMATVRPGVMNQAEKVSGKKGKLEEISVKIPALRTTVKDVVKEQKKNVDLPKAKIVVSGGRGMCDAECFKLIEKLANALGGEVGASRAAVEAGFIEKPHQVGQTGQTVKPDLYIAVGISGAIQHLAGMQNAKTIIAINKDPNAPIFKMCDYGIVGDAREVIPELINTLKAS